MLRLNHHLRIGLGWWNARGKTTGWLTRRRCRPWPEGLEGRALLSSIIEYPVAGENVSDNSASWNQITAGPDGNIWFTDGVTHATIDQVTPDGTITEFPVPTTSPGATVDVVGITLMPSGNLAFTEVGPARDRHDHNDRSGERRTDPADSDKPKGGADGHYGRAGRNIVVDRCGRQFDR